MTDATRGWLAWGAAGEVQVGQNQSPSGTLPVEGGSRQCRWSDAGQLSQQRMAPVPPQHWHMSLLMYARGLGAPRPVSVSAQSSGLLP